MSMRPFPLFSPLEQYLQSLGEVVIAAERLQVLDALADYVSKCLRAGGTARLVFICTHNSRRSHFAQVWAQVAAHRAGVGPVECFSGGTEVTACHPNTLRALSEAGLGVVAITAGSNPVYLIRYAEGVGPIVAFSKWYSSPPNPTQDFAAVTTCAHADEHCPIVPGASERFSLPYEDPKACDGTPQEKEAYAATCRQIAAEMQYVFSPVWKPALRGE